MGIESVRTYDKCESCAACPPFPLVIGQHYGSHIPSHRKQNSYQLVNGLSGQYLSNAIDFSFSTDFNHLSKLCKDRGILFEGTFRIECPTNDQIIEQIHTFRLTTEHCLERRNRTQTRFGHQWYGCVRSNWFRGRSTSMITTRAAASKSS